MENIVQVDVVLLNFLVGSLIPLVTALLTRFNASSAAKTAVNVTTSLLAGTGGYLLLHDGKASVVALATHAIAAFLASGVTYQNVWKPTMTTQRLGYKTQNFGVGGSPVSNEV